MGPRQNNPRSPLPRRTLAVFAVAGVLALSAVLSIPCPARAFDRPLAKTLEQDPYRAVVELPTRPGKTVRLYLVVPPQAETLCLLLPGYDGTLDLEWNGSTPNLSRDLLVRSQKLFTAQGLATCLMDAPSDRKGGFGLFHGFRCSGEHARDISATAAYLRKRFKRKIWLVGYDRGAVSALSGAARMLVGGPDGLVLISGAYASNHRGCSSGDLDLSLVKAPVLILHHNADACRLSPPRSAREVLGNLNNSPMKKLKYFSGGSRRYYQSCDDHAWHGLLGQEKKLVRLIAAWIKNPTDD